MSEMYGAGAGLLLAIMLLLAGCFKIARPREFAHLVYRLLPAGLRGRRDIAVASGPVVGTAELGLGGALLASPAGAVTVAALTAALFAAFCAVVVIAIRKGTSCGCFGSLSDGVAGAAELSRTLTLAAIAAGLLVVDLTGVAASAWSLRAVPAAVALAGVVSAVSFGAGRWGARRPDAAAARAWMLLGRPRSRIAGAGLPREAALHGEARRAVLAQVRATPTFLALRDWLGTDAGDIDLERAVVREAVATIPAGRVNCLLIVPPSRPGLAVTISVPWTAGRAGDPVIVGTAVPARGPDGSPATERVPLYAMSGRVTVVPAQPNAARAPHSAQTHTPAEASIAP